MAGSKILYSLKCASAFGRFLRVKDMQFTRSFDVLHLKTEAFYINMESKEIETGLELGENGF